MHILPIAALAVLPAAALAQSAALGTVDSALVRRILSAEDRRDRLDAALTDGVRHADSRIRALARRAGWRITDSTFAARDSLPTLPAPTVWPEPEWRLRYRGLAQRRADCGGLRAALADSAWPVRLRAVDLLSNACAGDDSLVSTLRAWVDALPPATERRDAGGVSWHAAAHAIVALSRLRVAEARPRIERLAIHRQPQVRLYAARAAAVTADTGTLRRLARDRDADVVEAAIVGLSKLTGHADDVTYLAALSTAGPQAVRAAALALKGSPRIDAKAAALAAFERWARRANASERDVRIALLEAAGRPASDDARPSARSPLPARAVALALGEDVQLRVTMSPASGGGSFVIRLRGDIAPIMAARVLELATSRHYYDRGNWHRIEHDFVIQGAGPGTNEYVGYHEFLRDELGNVPHTRGTLGMSTRGHDTGDAQWFVNLKDNLRLNGDYTVFAEVVEGIDVVDGIMEGDRIVAVTEASGKR